MAREPAGSRDRRADDLGRPRRGPVPAPEAARCRTRARRLGPRGRQRGAGGGRRRLSAEARRPDRSPGDGQGPAPSRRARRRAGASLMDDRITSGNEGLDEILGGGLPRNAINLIMGLPGSGKTMLCQQFMFAGATEERPAIYLSTVSEPFEKIV